MISCPTRQKYNRQTRPQFRFGRIQVSMPPRTSCTSRFFCPPPPPEDSWWVVHLPVYARSRGGSRQVLVDNEQRASAVATGDFHARSFTLRYASLILRRTYSRVRWQLCPASWCRTPQGVWWGRLPWLSLQGVALKLKNATPVGFLKLVRSRKRFGGRTRTAHWLVQFQQYELVAITLWRKRADQATVPSGCTSSYAYDMYYYSTLASMHITSYERTILTPTSI